jgi:hypothetical protein
LLARYGDQSGVEIETEGLGKKPSGDLALRRLASAVLNTAMVDLMDAEEHKSATQFFYSTADMDVWCGILDLNVRCVRDALEELGLLKESVELIPEVSVNDMMELYLKTWKETPESNREILLEIAHKLQVPYAVIHYYIYDQILPWKDVYKRQDLGKRFFKVWGKQVASKKGRGSASRVGSIIKAFRSKVVGVDCG